VGENIFLNLAAECSLILNYFIHKIFRDVNNVYFISNEIGERARSLSFAWIGMFWIRSR